MAGTETITLRLVAQDLMSGNVSKAIGSLDRLAKRGGLVGSVLQGVGQSMGQLINPVALVANGIGMVTDALQDGLQAYRDDLVSQEKLRTALEANIEAWDGNTDAIERTIAKRMDLGFSDDAQRESLALLVAQVEDVNDALDIQSTAMDLARLKNMSLADASNVLAKAYLGSGTALQKMGIKLGKGVAGMDAIAAVQQRVAGQAAAFAKTSAGAAERLDTKIGELQESIGAFIDGPATEFVTWMTDLVEVINGSAGDAAFKAIGQRLLEIKKGVVDVSDSAEQGVDPIKSYLDGLQAFNDVLNPATDEARDFRREMDSLRERAGVSEQAFVDLFFALKDEARLGVDGAKAALKDLLTSMILVDERTSVTTALLSDGWAQATASVEESTTGAALTVAEAMAGMKRSVRQAINGTLTTMDDMKGPWIEAWKEYARSAKDPFSQKAFENWLEKRAEKAVDKAREAAKEGRPKAARRWRELAAAFRDPVIVALTQINGSVIESMGIISLFKQQTKGLNNILPALGSVFGNDKDGGNGGHWKQTKNGVKWVEGNGFGATPYSLPAGGSGMGSGGHINVNVTHIGSMSEADGQRFARTVAPHISRELGRAGR
jgi:hypothetical protein